MPDLMTTGEVAVYLRLKDRKIYELVRTRRIPCARVAGKWLFPKAFVDRWLAEHIDHAGIAAAPSPPVIAGSHDPLLEWAVRESGCELALLSGGSEDGLRRLADRRAVAAGVHLIEPGTGDYNIAAASALAGLSDLVLIEWAWREQGLVLAPGNPLGIGGIEDLPCSRARVVRRQDGAGGLLLLQHLLGRAGVPFDGLRTIGRPARSETEVAEAVLDGEADCGLAVAAVARRFRLDFLPLHRERFDIALRRRDFFEPPLQRLIRFAATPALRERAAALGGYDVSGLGRVVHNA